MFWQVINLIVSLAHAQFLPQPGLGPHDAHPQQVDEQVETPSEAVFIVISNRSETVFIFIYKIDLWRYS